MPTKNKMATETSAEMFSYEIAVKQAVGDTRMIKNAIRTHVMNLALHPQQQLKEVTTTRWFCSSANFNKYNIKNK